MVNFKVIEGDDSYLTEVYESFKEDFLNPDVTVKDLKNKYDLSNAKYKNLRCKVLDETGLENKPQTYHGRKVKITDKTYISSLPSGNYGVVKYIDGFKESFGTYYDYETARIVRDKLIENDWDMNLASELKKEYGAGRPRPSVEKAKLVYDEFEELFFKGVDMNEIIDELSINQYQYGVLSEMVRKEHGLLSKKNSDILKK